MGGPGQQGAAEARVLEEGTDSSKISQDFLDVSGWAPTSAPERWARAWSCSWLLLGLQASCFACKHEAPCRCPSTMPRSPKQHASSPLLPPLLCASVCCPGPGAIWSRLL